MPERVERKRTKGWKMPANTIYVGRGSKWGNPHRLDKYEFESADMTRNAAVRDYTLSLDCGMLGYRRSDIIKALRGKNLACWCPLEGACHADILLKIANDERLK